MSLEITLKKGDITKATNDLGIHCFVIAVEAYANTKLENTDTQPEDNSNQENTETQSEDNLYPANIFVFQKSGTGLDPNQGDVFTKVATAIDLDAYPSYEYALDANQNLDEVRGFPFFRYNKLKLFVDAKEQIEDIWYYIQEDVKVLVNDYNNLQALNAGEEEVTIGN